MLHYLAPDVFPSESSFTEEFGNIVDSEQLERLQTVIAPYFLRRMKEDVEKNLPARRETLIEVDLSRTQKFHYKLLYEKDVSILMRGKKADLPSLNNLGMQLRKVCQHPWLLIGVEDREMRDAGLSNDRDADHPAILQRLVEASGKLVLLQKLLPKLQKEGHRVLIFSQMTRVLDIIQDALDHWGFLWERIDGNVTGNERQAAIDRYCRAGSDRFIFLLSTKAGGLGLNLQQADTIIIFDSDWNPQNDLQAISRAHRQTDNTHRQHLQR